MRSARPSPRRTRPVRFSVSCPPILCEPGTVPHDTNGDGCPDACLPGPCFTSEECGAGFYCAAPPGHCRDPGACDKRPAACPADLFDPVCGCDGTTYPGPCEAAAAGVRVAAPGTCECRDACDCYRLPFADVCPLLCPACGSYWTCEQGRCVEHCGFMPPQVCTVGGG